MRKEAVSFIYFGAARPRFNDLPLLKRLSYSLVLSLGLSATL